MTLSWDLNRLNAQISLNKNGKNSIILGFELNFNLFKNFVFTSWFTVFYLLILKLNYFLTLSRPNKKFVLIFAKFSPRNNRFSWISKPLKFLWYLFSFASYREKIGLHIFFNSAHFFIFLFFYFNSAKSAHSLEFECVWLFLYLAPFKWYLKNKIPFFYSSHHF